MSHEPLMSGWDRAIVGPHDNRRHTTDTKAYPFNTVCHLMRDFGDGRWRGASGVFIAPNVILTAAHCLYKHRLGRGPVRLLAAPGQRDRDNTPLGKWVGAAFHVPRAYITASPVRRRRYDYGVVVLKRRAGLDRFMPLRAPTRQQWRQWTTTRPLTVCGYPSDKPFGTQWYHREFLRVLTPTRLFYTVDTCPGHSGSPIWAGGGPEPVLVGVHTTGATDKRGRPYGCKRDSVLAPDGALNSGVRFTAQVLHNLRQAVRGRSRAMRRFVIG